MAHVLIVDMDDVTLNALMEFIERAKNARTPPVNLSYQGRVTGNKDDNFQLVTLSEGTRRVGGTRAPRATPTPYPVRDPPILRSTEELLPTHPRFTLVFDRWRLDVETRELWTVDEGPVPISDGEFELLFTFTKHPQRALTRQRIIALMSGEARLTRPRSVDVCVSRLRHKLETNARCPRIIQTVRDGYKFTMPVTVINKG